MNSIYEKTKTVAKKHPFIVKLVRIFQRNAFFKKKIYRKIKGRQNKIEIDASVLLINCGIDILGNNNKIKVSSSSLLNEVTILIKGNNNLVSIDENVIFSRNAMLWIEDDNCMITIGKNTTFEQVHLAATECDSIIKIGEDCMFAYDIDLRTGDSHSMIDLTTMKRTNYAKNIEISDHVWIASHVSILKGVRILENSVIATRSVVTKPINEKEVLIGGIPAKILKNNISWDRKRI